MVKGTTLWKISKKNGNISEEKSFEILKIFGFWADF